MPFSGNVKISSLGLQIINVLKKNKKKKKRKKKRKKKKKIKKKKKQKVEIFRKGIITSFHYCFAHQLIIIL